MTGSSDISSFTESDLRIAPESLSIEEVDAASYGTIFRLNQTIFAEERIINTFERSDLMMLLASVEGRPVGFKIGYRENRFTFYSAKGGVLADYRRKGIARAMLHDMMRRAGEKGYSRFVFDTFPNRHPGMTILGLREGFRVMKADYNPTYRDYRLRFEKKI